MDEDAVLRSETDFFVEFVPALDFLSSCLCVCVCLFVCVCERERERERERES